MSVGVADAVPDGEPKGRALKKARDLEAQAQKKLLERREKELLEFMKSGQLVLWGAADRGAPNEMLRSALFSTKNRNVPRASYSLKAPLKVEIIGGGYIRYYGEELRQDDETVWMQLVHLAKEARSEGCTFTPHSLIKELGWSSGGPSYARLLETIRRLGTGSLEVYSPRFDKGISLRLIDTYVYSESDATGPWHVKVFNSQTNNVFMFEKLYSRVDWSTRLALPEGVATWLHSFFATHREPYPHKLETLALGAGIPLEIPEDLDLDQKARIARQKQRLRDAKKTIKRGLEALVKQGFLLEFTISRTNLVAVKRAV